MSISWLIIISTKFCLAFLSRFYSTTHCAISTASHHANINNAHHSFHANYSFFTNGNPTNEDNAGSPSDASQLFAQGTSIPWLIVISTNSYVPFLCRFNFTTWSSSTHHAMPPNSQPRHYKQTKAQVMQLRLPSFLPNVTPLIVPWVPKTPSMSYRVLFGVRVCQRGQGS